MKKITKRLIAILIMVAMTVNMVNPVIATENSEISVIKRLTDIYESQDGSFELAASSRFYIVSDSEPADNSELLQVVQLVQQQFATDELPTGEALDIVWGPEDWAKEGDIIVKLDTSSQISAEGYELNVSGTATVTAIDVNGLLYGLNMLQKYFRAADSKILSGFTASDTPDTKERTVMLDCGRKYFTKDWICNFIREISWMGYNTIELHFSEDGGFRMDFWDPAYYTEGYSPQNDFSWICGSKPQSWVASTYQNDPDKGKYLTTAEIIEILKTAKTYHIDVIPSFDTPAHVDYLTWQFEQNYLSNKSYSFKYNGKTYKTSDVNGCINYCKTTGYDEDDYNWPDYSSLDITNSVAKAFVFQLYTDIANFFKVYAGSDKFNIGADEVALNYSETWDYSDFPVYVNELDNLLNSFGFTTRIFNDFIGTANTSYTSGQGVTIDSFNSDIEILYWNSPFNPTTGKYAAEDESKVLAAQKFVDDGRTIYNVIVTNTYFCTRVTNSGSDARDPNNRQWQVYHSNEEDIFNEWYPASVREHGDYSETQNVVPDIPDSQLGGAYFCLWHDYAALSTESQIWNGVNSSGKWNVIDRMWSNTIKMWNSDVDNTVTYDEYADVRDRFGYFPGYISCSKAVSFPDATVPTQAYLADHSELIEALADKISNNDGTYTEDSYANYTEAYEAAEKVNTSYDATSEDLAKALSALKTAEENLVKADESESSSGNQGSDTDTGSEAEINFKAICKTTVNGETKIVRTVKYTISGSEFYVYMSPMTGYKFKRIEGATYTPLDSNDGSGFIAGSMDADGVTTITVWYENIPNTSRLKDVIDYAPEGQGSYTDESWKAYQAALEAAKNFEADDTTMQADVDAVVAALEDAQSRLVTTAEATKIIEIEKVCETARLGKQVGLKITTTPDVETLTVTNKATGITEKLNLCTGKVQTLNTNETVKIWLVNYDADEAGNFTYTVTAGITSDTVDITVK